MKRCVDNFISIVCMTEYHTNIVILLNEAADKHRDALRDLVRSAAWQRELSFWECYDTAHENALHSSD